MIVVVDGPDCSGKSTLITNLREILSGDDVESLHAGPPTRHPLDEYERPLYERRDQPGHILCDRWDLGEHIYPHIFGRPTALNSAVARHIELFKRAYGVLEIIINPRLSTLIDCMNSRPESERDMTAAQLDDARSRFAALPATGNHRLYYSLTDPCDSLDQIMDLAFGLAEDAQRLRPFATYVGQPRPRFILFGERRGTGDQYLTMGNAPAFGPYPATSGAYLLEHLDVPRMGGALANACDVDNPLKLWEAVERPPVVSLGVNAHEALNDFDIPHGAMPHPQYVRRFHNSYGMQYAIAVIETLRMQRNELKWRP